MREEPLDHCSSTMLQRQLPCHAFLHRGQQMSGALSTLCGERVNLVVWLRSSDMRNRRCPLCDRAPGAVGRRRRIRGWFHCPSLLSKSRFLAMADPLTEEVDPTVAAIVVLTTASTSSAIMMSPTELRMPR
ncbi:hypothetical protein HPB50_001454 [Hyalomma asiaticum]|uniref:Uncharacterized protein n=1 Tax=Hyalomma asiaticum TaxID=266040 RepID=A0ACB7SFI5_HYAAI|nr:hypothetical protein HPB50_001454 [Hyalomma asiaticum]